MTAAVIGACSLSAGCRIRTLQSLAALCLSALCRVFPVQVLQIFFQGIEFDALIRGAMSIAFFAIFISIANSLLKEWSPKALIGRVSRIWPFVENYPFSFVLVGAFTMVNGLFFYLLRAPTALGRPIMDQLAGFRLYLETAESDRLNLNAPEITADRFEALLPYAVALDVEKPWSDAFAAALRRAHPDDPDPMSHYRRLELRRQLVEQQFRQRGFVVGRERQRRACQRSAGLIGFVRLFRRWRRRPVAAVAAAVEAAGKTAGARDSRGPPC